MCVFPHPANAVNAATEMQTQMSHVTRGSHPMRLHIGLHAGPVIVENGDVFGGLFGNLAQVADKMTIIRSMTRAERRDPSVLNASRRRRIANGSGTTLPEVNRLVKQFTEMQKLMKQMAHAGRRGGLGFPARR